MPAKVKPLLLVVLDGWGLRDSADANAIKIAGTPNVDAFAREFPWTSLDASGLAVGLPEGQMGNSEVGHTNIGAGRVVYQDIVRINHACESGSIYSNEVLLQAMTAAKKADGAVHFLGLVSPGGVHSSMGHLFSLMSMARRESEKHVYVHAFLDGRDTPPKSATAFVDELVSFCDKGHVGEVASVSGRFYAMDRDKRWERVKLAYDAMVKGQGVKAASAGEAVQEAYGRGETDEFVKPTVIVEADGSPTGTIHDGDTCIFFNFRPDRARQMTRALTDGSFKEFERGVVPRLSAFVCMTQYDKTFGLPVAFPPEQPSETFGEIVSAHGLRQFRIAETEKYAHVTFFFNGGREVVFPGEERVLVPSVRDVGTYDLKPEMSARAITSELVKRLDSGEFQFLLVNYANPDMVGHTGKLDSTVKAVRCVDECLGELWTHARSREVAMVVTADHGNCEMMVDPKTGQLHTAHTLNPVPLHLNDPSLVGKRLDRGVLADVAPTCLQMMGIPQPKAMTGRPLFR
jgi:2,3-bisphosphoglycerate-independent phosphoglycerate mutase